MPRSLCYFNQSVRDSNHPQVEAKDVTQYHYLTLDVSLPSTSESLFVLYGSAGRNTHTPHLPISNFVVIHGHRKNGCSLACLDGTTCSVMTENERLVERVSS